MADTNKGLRMMRTCKPGPDGADCRAAYRTEPTPGSATQKRKKNKDAHRNGPHSKPAAKR